MKDKPKETNPSTVSNATKQDGEARARWAWTEPAVWTERMLIALENGVKGNVWPNAYFAKQGLFSLATAHAEACQSR